MTDSKFKKAWKKWQYLSRKAMYPVTVLVLFFVYWLAVGLTAILMKIFRQDPLMLRKFKRDTMWIERKPEKPDMNKAVKQF